MKSVVAKHCSAKRKRWTEQERSFHLENQKRGSRADLIERSEKMWFFQVPDEHTAWIYSRSEKFKTSWNSNFSIVRWHTQNQFEWKISSVFTLVRNLQEIFFWLWEKSMQVWIRLMCELDLFTLAWTFHAVRIFFLTSVNTFDVSSCFFMNSIQILFVFCVWSHSRKSGIPTGLEFLAARKLHVSVNGP